MRKMIKIVNKLNDFIASKFTIVMGTMWCVYAFALWSILPIEFPSLQQLVFYVSGGIIQLVALPLIMVGQQVLNRGSEKRANQDHRTLIEEFKEIKSLHQLLSEEVTDNKNEVIELRKLEAKLDRILILLDKPSEVETSVVSIPEVKVKKSRKKSS